MLEFEQLVSVNFQGTVIVFGRVVGSTSADIYFNVLGQDDSADDPKLDWTGFTKLDFPDQLRQAGMSLITVAADATTRRPSRAPFRVITDQAYISVIQQSELGTLYVNRFRLLKTQTESTQNTTSYSLNPAWEVRFARSGKEDVPADSADSQGFINADGQPFLEPTLELSMVDGVSNGNFEVFFLPVTGQSCMAWQFVTLRPDGTSLNMFNFPPSDTGLLDYSGKTITTQYEIEPDSVFSLAPKAEGDALPVQSPPRAAAYTKHENVVGPDGTSIGVKRAVRVMLAIPVTQDDVVKTATIDSAVGPAGTIAELSGAIVADAITPAEFDLDFTTAAHLSLVQKGGKTNPLAISGPYDIGFLVSPSGLLDGAQIIGGATDADPKTAAPFVRIVDGGKLEIGFGDGSSSVTCRTLQQVLFPGNWSAIEVSYAGKGENPFTVKLNGNVTPLTSVTAAAEPSGTAISLIGAMESGFEGALNQIKVTVADDLVLDLPCDSVDYTVQPATTPNTASADIVAEVYGAKSEPSSAPVSANSNGAFYVSEDGLSYYVGLADFIAPQSAICLMDGSDGLLHLYFKGADADLSVTQYSKTSARATFSTDWNTDWSQGGGEDQDRSASMPSIRAAAPHMFYQHRAQDWSHVSATVLASPEKAQSGQLSFVAHRVGTSLNQTEITVRPSAVSTLLCDVTVAATGGIGSETWTGLPRDINQFVKIWNGAASGSPDDPDVLNQSEPFFDYGGALPIVLAPSVAEDSYFLFTSVPGIDPQLQSVTVTQSGRPDEVDLAFVAARPANWDEGKIAHNWPAAPASARGLMDLMTGRSTSYDYASVTTPGTRAYASEVTLNRSDEAQAHVIFFVRDALKDFTLVIEQGTSSAYCTVKIAGTKLDDVPRDQIAFAKIINGEDKKYGYPDGYKAEIAKKVFAKTNGLSGSVMNTKVAEAANALAYAGLLRVLYQGQSYDASAIQPIAKTDASAFQKATLTTGSGDTVVRGSRLFGCLVPDPPTNGGIGRLSDTAHYEGGRAPISVLGVNGGWMRVTPQFSLTTSVGNAGTVEFSVDKTPKTEAIALGKDLTIEGWIKPDASGKGQLTRALTYNVTGNLSDPDLPIQYMLGSQQGPALITGSSTYFQKSFNFQPPNMTVQAYVKLDSDSASGTVLTIFAVTGGATYLTLSVNQMGQVEANLRDGAAQVTSTQALSASAWTCLTVTVTKTAADKVTLKLFLDDGAPVTAEADNTFTDRLGTLMVGSDLGTAVPARLNGIAFWQRALSDTEAVGSYTYGFPDNDAELGIRWNLAEGTGTEVMNSADTGSEFNAKIINPVSPSWDENGAFDVPYAGRNDYILQSNRIIKDWTHVALSSQQGWGVDLGGANSGKVSDGDAFKPGSDLALEIWMVPQSANSKQMIFEKPGSYSFYLDTLGQVNLQLDLEQASESYQNPPQTYNAPSISAPVELGKTNHVVVNFTTGAVADSTGSTGMVQTKYFLRASVYVNGQLAMTPVDKEDLTQPVSFKSEDSPFYMGISGKETFNFQGLLSHARVWSRTLNSAEIAQVYNFHGYPSSTDGLVAGWDFADQDGKTAKDVTKNNDMTLTSNQLWTVWQDVSQAEIFVDGGASIPQRKTAADVGGYGVSQFTFGALKGDTASTLPFKGQLDDIRLFDIRLTQQQIAEARNTPYVGSETGLCGYWKIEAGSGHVIYDATGKGNNGTVVPSSAVPGWTSDAAPIQNEADTVVNALGGAPAYAVAQVSDAPSVIEYATTQRDAYDKLYSVMMRGYFYVTPSETTVLQLGYKVGDLDTIYVGQVQTKPSIIGYIEGGPPLPSENQTLAYWSGDMGGPASAYASISSVTYVESDAKTWSFEASSSAQFISEFNFSGGFYQKSETSTSVGVGAEAETQVLENKFTLGGKIALSGGIGSSDDVAQSHEYTETLTSSFAPAGEWEPADNILNPTVGRRYIQNNIGSAVVKSAVADMYMQALKGTQTPVGYTLVPNDTIPIDSNIIDFPINPKYVKNGTLDGKVGLVNDPDYPGANEERGSYFKPVEAYDLKRKIEKQEEQLKAYHDQFDTTRFSVLGSMGAVKSKLKENPAYDFAAKVNKRSLVNTYVWTAAGGMRREEQSVANSYMEKHSGASDLKFALGAELKADIGTPFGGFYIETDAMFGGSFTMSASKADAAANSFSLSCTVDPTDFLPAPKLHMNDKGELEFLGYETSPAPGKVDGYRYMSFMLAPKEENFTALNQVIDQNWLNNSTSAAANAMREAIANPTEPWRILYRTTYVSRVPAPFQPVRDDTTAPNIVAPANLASNYWFLGVMDELITDPNPTPTEIGDAIDQVLGTGTTPGLLKDIVPWWADFFAAAQVYGSTDFIELADLRSDLLDYMISKYEAEAYALS